MFDTRSNWGHPKTLALKVSSVTRRADKPIDDSLEPSDLGCGFVDLSPMWNMKRCANVESKTKIYLFDSAEEFDQHGEAVEGSAQGEKVSSAASQSPVKCSFSPSLINRHLFAYGIGCISAFIVKSLELHFRISVEVISYESQPRKRLLLYKHGDDLRQELLAIQFVEKCNQILLSSGLDLKLKTFSCQPVGNRTVGGIRVYTTMSVLMPTGE